MNSGVFLVVGLLTLLCQCKSIGQEEVHIPRQANEFVWVYKPAGDHLFGPDTRHLDEGSGISPVWSGPIGGGVDKLQWEVQQR